MPWFRVDDNLAFHHKVVAAGNAAMGLWVRAGSLSAQQLTDGFVPDHMLAALGGTKQHAQRLVDAGLWDREDDGYRFHEWTERQPDARSVKLKREAESRGGARGNHERWHKKRRVVDPECEFCTSGTRSGTRRPPDQVPDGVPESGANPPVPARPDTSGGATPSPASEVSAQTLVAEWIDHSAQRPPGDVIGQVSKRLKSLLADGIDPDVIRRGLADWDRKNLHPSTLPSVVHEAQKATSSNVVHLADGRVKLPPLPPTSPWGGP